MSLREKYQVVRNESDQKQIKIEALEKNENDLKQQIETLTKEKAELLNYKTITEPEFDSTKNKLAEAEEQIRLMELSRFASAYKTQEDEYRKEQKMWFLYVLGASVFLTISILFSIFAPEKYHSLGQWYGEPGFYLLDAMFLTLFVYALKKHSHLGNLIVDYLGETETPQFGILKS